MVEVAWMDAGIASGLLGNILERRLGRPSFIHLAPHRPRPQRVYCLCRRTRIQITSKPVPIKMKEPGSRVKFFRAAILVTIDAEIWLTERTVASAIEFSV